MIGDKRQTAYQILNQMVDMPAQVWYGVKHEVMAEWPMTLHQMNPLLALAVVVGLYREFYLGEPNRIFKYHHRPLSPQEYDEMWEKFAA